jgi:hypothetical protein
LLSICCDIGRNPRWRSITPEYRLGTPAGSVLVSRNRLALVKQSTANVISTIVMLVSAVRNFRFRMLAIPSTIAAISTLPRARLAPSTTPRPLRIRLSSLSNLP